MWNTIGIFDTFHPHHSGFGAWGSSCSFPQGLEWPSPKPGKSGASARRWSFWRKNWSKDSAISRQWQGGRKVCCNWFLSPNPTPQLVPLHKIYYLRDPRAIFVIAIYYLLYIFIFLPQDRRGENPTNRALKDPRGGVFVLGGGSMFTRPHKIKILEEGRKEGYIYQESQLPMEIQDIFYQTGNHLRLLYFQPSLFSEISCCKKFPLPCMSFAALAMRNARGWGRGWPDLRGLYINFWTIFSSISCGDTIPPHPNIWTSHIPWSAMYLMSRTKVSSMDINGVETYLEWEGQEDLLSLTVDTARCVSSPPPPPRLVWEGVTGARKSLPETGQKSARKTPKLLRRFAPISQENTSIFLSSCTQYCRCKIKFFLLLGMQKIIYSVVWRWLVSKHSGSIFD